MLQVCSNSQTRYLWKHKTVVGVEPMSCSPNQCQHCHLGSHPAHSPRVGDCPWNLFYGWPTFSWLYGHRNMLRFRKVFTNFNNIMDDPFGISELVWLYICSFVNSSWIFVPSSLVSTLQMFIVCGSTSEISIIYFLI